MKIKAPRLMTTLLVSIMLTGYAASSKSSNKSPLNINLTKISDIFETKYLVYAKENANIRESNSSSSEKIGLLIKGETLPYIETTENGWCKVKYDGKYAYIFNTNLDIVPYLKYNKKEIPWINDINKFIQKRKMIITTAKVNIRKEPNTNSKVYTLLSKGNLLPLVEEYNKKWLKVIYNGEYAYVYKKYTNTLESYYIDSEMKDMVYATSKTDLINIDTLETITKIPKRESLKVYGQNKSYYLTEYNGIVGYINKEYFQSLGDNYVIIDISDQHLDIYNDDKLIISSDIVTGKDDTPTYCGLFTINDKKRNVYWEEFDVKVKYWMPFNRGEGLHDASWRKKFGGNIYEKDGSHGCVNLPKDIAKEVYENVEIGTPVLVKR